VSRLYLRCAICDRQQAEGIISSAAWGRLELANGVQVEHPALKGLTLRACPTCVERHPDWKDQALAALGLDASALGAPP
jgi:hypothetical protein